VLRSFDTRGATRPGRILSILPAPDPGVSRSPGHRRRLELMTVAPPRSSHAIAGLAHPAQERRHLRGVLDALGRFHAAADIHGVGPHRADGLAEDRKSTRLNSSHVKISYAVFCLKK